MLSVAQFPARTAADLLRANDGELRPAGGTGGRVCGDRGETIRTKFLAAGGTEFAAGRQWFSTARKQPGLIDHFI